MEECNVNLHKTSRGNEDVKYHTWAVEGRVYERACD